MGISYRLEWLLFERTIHAAKKPCRVNIQFATIRTARQLAALQANQTAKRPRQAANLIVVEMRFLQEGNKSRVSAD